MDHVIATIGQNELKWFGWMDGAKLKESGKQDYYILEGVGEDHERHGMEL